MSMPAVDYDSTVEAIIEVLTRRDGEVDAVEAACALAGAFTTLLRTLKSPEAKLAAVTAALMMLGSESKAMMREAVE